MLKPIEFFNIDKEIKLSIHEYLTKINFKNTFEKDIYNFINNYFNIENIKIAQNNIMKEIILFIDLCKNYFYFSPNNKNILKSQTLKNDTVNNIDDYYILSLKVFFLIELYKKLENENIEYFYFVVNNDVYDKLKTYIENFKINFWLYQEYIGYNNFISNFLNEAKKFDEKSYYIEPKNKNLFEFVNNIYISYSKNLGVEIPIYKENNDDPFYIINIKKFCALFNDYDEDVLNNKYFICFLYKYIKSNFKRIQKTDISIYSKDMLGNSIKISTKEHYYLFEKITYEINKNVRKLNCVDNLLNKYLFIKVFEVNNQSSIINGYEHSLINTNYIYEELKKYNKEKNDIEKTKLKKYIDKELNNYDKLYQQILEHVEKYINDIFFEFNINNLFSKFINNPQNFTNSKLSEETDIDKNIIKLKQKDTDSLDTTILFLLNNKNIVPIINILKENNFIEVEYIKEKSK